VIAARTVERGKNPEDGTGKGLATLAHHGDGSAVDAANGAPGVVRSREKETQERRIPSS
jgi:hypothetical protein